MPGLASCNGSFLLWLNHMEEDHIVMNMLYTTGKTINLRTNHRECILINDQLHLPILVTM